MRQDRGFSLVELVIVMAVISLILAVALPALRGMQVEGDNTKVEHELNTLKTAVVSFWRNNNLVYPNDLNALILANPQIISIPLADPYKTSNATYGYEKGTDPNFGDYFILYSKGPRGDTTNSTISFANGVVSWSGSGRVISNAPTIKQ